MQEKFGFRFPLPALLAQRTDKDRHAHTGELLTDDFAPVNLYDTMGDEAEEVAVSAANPARCSAT